MDVAREGFPTINVINLMKEFAKKEQVDFKIDECTREKLNQYLTGLKVIYQIPDQPRTKRTRFRINKLGPSANKHYLEHEGSHMTIVEYFARYKNYTLKYPDIPCLWVSAVNEERKTYLPAELCTIVDTRMKQVDTRVLPTVTVNKEIRQMEQFNQASNLESYRWIIIDLSKGAVTFPDIRRFADLLSEKPAGIKTKYNRSLTLQSYDKEEITNIFNDFKIDYQLFLFILPNKRKNEIYNVIKQVAETNCILTQCVKAKNVSQCIIPFIKGIILKINSKLNGVNFNQM